jgi:hypothetical protein
MCRCRTSLIRGTKKGHGKISWPNPIGKHIQVLQQNPPKSCRDIRSPPRQLRAMNGLPPCTNTASLFAFSPP